MSMTRKAMRRSDLMEEFFDQTEDVNEFLWREGRSDDDWFEDLPPAEQPPSDIDHYALATFYMVRAWSHFDRADLEPDDRVDDLDTLAGIIESGGDLGVFHEYRTRK